MKQIVISGNVGKDAVLRTTQRGDKVASWSVGVTERGEEKRTLWFDVSLWGARAEALLPHITKGSKLSVAGELSTREHEGKVYLTIRADQVTLMGGGPERSSTAQAAHMAQRPALDGDSIPFAPEVRG